MKFVYCLEQNLYQILLMKFISKTFEILQNKQLQRIISWNQDGSGFLIFQKKQFIDEVLPVYFKHCKYPSFIRQLNNYGFKQVKSKEYTEFSHQHFTAQGFDLKKIQFKRSSFNKDFLSHYNLEFIQIQHQLYKIVNNQQELYKKIAECQQLSAINISNLRKYVKGQGYGVKILAFMNKLFDNMIDSNFKTEMINQLQNALKSTEYTIQSNSLLNPFFQLKNEIQFQSLEDRLSENQSQGNDLKFDQISNYNLK
ncbi:Heat shock factor protein 4 [Paramecium bursaria]